MSRLVKGRSGPIRLIGVIILLLGGGGAVLWGRMHLFPSLDSEASAAYARGEWARAASLAQRRLKEAPLDPMALRWAARAAARQDQDRKAIAIYNRLAPESKDAEDFFLQSRGLLRAGQFVPAYQACQAALEKDPDHPEALAAMAAMFARTDRYHAAEEAAERLARQPAAEARAQVILGSLRAEVNDSAGAAQAFARALQLDPEGRVNASIPVAQVRKLLAGSLLRSSRAAEARPVLEMHLKAGPDPEATWLLGRCFIQEGDWDRAAATLGHPPYRDEHPLEPEPAPYVGESRCAECHRAQSDAVLASRHAATFFRGRELGSFPLPPDPLPDPGNPRVSHQFRREGDSLTVETRTSDRVLRAVVDYAFGSRDHLATFVGRDDRGGSVMVRMSPYRSPRGEGWDVATGLPSLPADEEEYLGKKMFPVDGVRRCIACHATSVHSVLDGAGPEAADRSIGCERCHGPGGHHLAAVAAGFADLAIVSPGRASPAAVDAICEKCHGAQQPEGINLPRTDPVWLRFQSLTLKWSRCYTESNEALGCVTCHDPHRDAETSAVKNEAKCLSCHAPDRGATSSVAAGSKDPGRKAGGPGARAAAKVAGRSCPVNPTRGCIDCHMPRIWVPSTHSFKTDHLIRVRDQAASESRAPAVH